MTSSSSHAKRDDKNGKEEKEEKSSSSSEAHKVELLINIELEKVGDRSWPSDYSIYRLPETLVDEKPEAYIPHRVSIGPIYHGYSEHLKDMEARKMLCLDKFLKRERPGAAAAATTLSDYIKAVRKLEEIAYQCYPEEDVNKIERNRFAMMMVVDGCFILELLLQYEDRTTSESDAKWSFLVLLDLILVENQLPIFVLEALYGLFINEADAWTALYNLI
ncbi:UPF0481 protein At3g47200-like [Macadamia integrifolia]|uniref:UPF0481 protein At3g47200-like n=1 Tax=Macadamia integrifolia TaxID=60698 RepID=UPI001C4F5C85|nr:UPF0481 protein At3g47200-like [Macadamia integrifolia]